MQAAAKSLGCTFEVVYSNNDHFVWLNAIKEAATAAEKPDAIVTLVMKGHGKEALDIFESTKVYGFLVNAGLSEEQYKEFGAPRSTYKYWLGEMMPDDKGAGEKLAAALYEAALKKGLAGQNGKVAGIGIAANPSDGASVERQAGLEGFAVGHPDIELLQVIKAKWERPTAKMMTEHMLRRYANIRIVWSASDAMALGAAEAITEKGAHPGKDILLGGVDWSTEGFDAIKKGTLTASVGGHVMEGAWAAIVLFDYLNGIDFAASEGLRMQSPMYVADAGNVDAIRGKINAGNWEKIDYKTFSKFYHPDIKKYNFTLLDTVAPQTTEKGK
jgi:ABC-type sugar transport system substrate-binding protein